MMSPDNVYSSMFLTQRTLNPFIFEYWMRDTFPKLLSINLLHALLPANSVAPHHIPRFII